LFLSTNNFPCLWVQLSPMHVKPLHWPFGPIRCLWSDPFSNEGGLSLFHLRHGTLVATCPQNMVIFLFCSICLILFWPLQSFRRWLVLHKCVLVIFYLL
jgi:hypothetical protein